MKTAIIIGAFIFVWLVLSQLIAWMITPSQDEDAVVESWFVVFMLPVVLMLVGVMVLEFWWIKLARKCGFPVGYVARLLGW